jgi:hypothetical protein
MDWFYEYCECQEFKRPENNLNFHQFCLISHVWLKSKWHEMGAEDRSWLAEELYQRGKNAADSELGLFVDCVRQALKRNFILNSGKLIESILRRQLTEPFLVEGVLKLLCLIQDLERENTSIDQNLIENAIFSIEKCFHVDASQEFYDYCFVANENFDKAINIHILRKLVLLKPALLTPVQFHHVFIDSESEFIKGLHRHLQLNTPSFLKFYTALVKITDVDVFVSESPAHVAFFTSLLAKNLKFSLSVRQFHTLLRLKCELEAENHLLLSFLEF